MLGGRTTSLEHHLQKILTYFGDYAHYIIPNKNEKTHPKILNFDGMFGMQD